jgi:hypothetical protein
MRLLLLPQMFKQFTIINPAENTEEGLQMVIINTGMKLIVWQATEKNFGMVGH